MHFVRQSTYRLCFRKPVYRNLWAINVFRKWKDYKYTCTFLASLCPSIGIRNGEAFQEFRICKTNSMVRLGYFSPSWAFGIKLKGGYKEEGKYEVLESSFTVFNIWYYTIFARNKGLRVVYDPGLQKPRGFTYQLPSRNIQS